MVESIEMLRQQLAALQKKYEEIEQANRELTYRLMELYSLHQISRTLTITLDFEEIMKVLKKLFRSTFEVNQYSLMLLDESLDKLQIKSYFGIPKSAVNQTTYRLGEDIFGRVVETGKYIYVPDMKEEARYSFHPGKWQKQGSFLSIPLMPEDHRPIGVLNLYRNHPYAFEKRELMLLNKVAHQIARVVDKTLLFKHTKELSVTDELTGIYNRRYFNQRYEREIQRAKRYGRSLTVVMIDIDHFKKYNDIHGHIMGDQVLKTVAHILDSIIRKADILARFGGEEFVLLLPEINKERSLKAAEKLRKAIEKHPFEGQETQPNGKITISLGLATFPEDATDAQTLLELADKSLYVAKTTGRNRVGQ